MGEATHNDFLPALNAILNGLAFVFLLLGYLAIKKSAALAEKSPAMKNASSSITFARYQNMHRVCMTLAFLISCLFLTSYLYYHFNYESQKFTGQGIFRYLYFTMLITHIVGAVVLVPGVIKLLLAALKSRWVQHKKTARWVWPLWMYTSLTGVLVYFCLYGDRNP